MDLQDSEKLRQYRNKQILVVGEGDFSFSLCLAKAFGSATNITATSLDIREELGHNYNNGKTNVDELERLWCTVVRGVNVHSMTSDYRLARYAIIFLKFPHAGKHYRVVEGFMESAREMVNDEYGEIHIFHKTIYPFNEIDMKALAEEKGLRLAKMKQSIKWPSPVYSNKSESGSNCDFIFPIGTPLTLLFKK